MSTEPESKMVNLSGYVNGIYTFDIVAVSMFIISGLLLIKILWF